MSGRPRTSTLVISGLFLAVLAGVAEGLTVCDGRGDSVGRGEVDVAAGAVEEDVVSGCVAAVGAGTGTGRTRM